MRLKISKSKNVKIYYELGINKICNNISDKYKFEFDLDNILSRLIYSRDDRITAHFTICFLSLVIHRYLEKVLMEEFTRSEIINCLRNMKKILKDVKNKKSHAFLSKNQNSCKS